MIGRQPGSVKHRSAQPATDTPGQQVLQSRPTFIDLATYRDSITHTSFPACLHRMSIRLARWQRYPPAADWISTAITAHSSVRGCPPFYDFHTASPSGYRREQE